MSKIKLLRRYKMHMSRFALLKCVELRDRDLRNLSDKDSAFVVRILLNLKSEIPESPEQPESPESPESKEEISPVIQILLGSVIMR